MAATNYTPIQLYYSTTASAAPLAANLVNGELGINITDGKLYYKDNAGVVQVIATKGAGTIGGSNTQIQFNDGGALAGNAAMTFNKSTNVTTFTTLNLTNALGAAYGGTAQSTYAQGDILYASAANTLSKLTVGTANYILTSTGSVPQWVAPTSVTVQTANNLAGGAAGSVPYQSAADTTTFLTIGSANRVMTSTGSAPQWVTALTGLTGVSSSSMTNTSLTSGRLVYSTTGGAQTDSSSLTFDGTTLSTTGLSNSGSSTLVKLVKLGDTAFTAPAVLSASAPAKLYVSTATVTDGSSAGGATNTLGTIASFGQTAVAATNTSVTYTNLATLYIAGAPTAGANVTITNPYSLYVAAGASYFGGDVSFANLPVFSGGTANGVVYLNASKQFTTGSALTFDGTTLVAGAAAPLTIGTATLIQAQGTGYAAGRYSVNASEPVLNYGKSRSGTTAALGGAVVSGDRLGALQFYGDDGSAWVQSAKFWAEVNGTVTSGSVPSNFIWSLSGSEQMRLTSTGLGIGTSSVSYKLDVNGTARFNNTFDFGAGQNITSGSGAYKAAKFGAASGAYNVLFSGSTAFQINDNADTANLLVLTNSGNFGLGVTPQSTSGSGVKAFEVAGSGMGISGNPDNTWVTANAYFNSSWKYAQTGKLASMYNTAAGTHSWYTAPSGTAGNAITFTQAMTLDASGQLGVGTTSPVYKLDVLGSVRLKTGATGTPVIVSTGGDSQGTLRFGSASTEYSINGGADYLALVFNVNGAEGMRLTSTGLGIGTSNPLTKLNVESGNVLLRGGYMDFGPTAGANGAGRISSALAGTVSGSLIFSTLNSSAVMTEAMRLDSAGNLGLGGAPSGWFGNFRVIQAGTAAFYGYSSNDRASMSQNYYDPGGAPKYITANFATQYLQYSGEHRFYTAPSGAAGASLSFTQAMTLDASGNLIVGGTSALNSASGRGNITINGSSSSILSLAVGAANKGYIYHDGTILDINNQANGALTFQTNATERARIDSSGNLLVGTTTTPVGNQVNGHYFYANGGYNSRTTPSNRDWGISTSSGSIVNFYSDNGSAAVYAGAISVNGNVTTYGSISDYRLKHVIGTVADSGSRIDALEPVEYEWKADGTRTRGFLAHKFQEVYPQSVTGEKDAVDADGKPVYQAMQAGGSEVIADLVAEIQSLRKRLAAAGIA